MASGKWTRPFPQWRRPFDRNWYRPLLHVLAWKNGRLSINESINLKSAKSRLQVEFKSSSSRVQVELNGMKWWRGAGNTCKEPLGLWAASFSSPRPQDGRQVEGGGADESWEEAGSWTSREEMRAPPRATQPSTLTRDVGTRRNNNNNNNNQNNQNNQKW